MIITRDATHHVFIEQPLPPHMRCSTLRIRHKSTHDESVINAADWNILGSLYTDESYELVSTKPEIVSAKAPEPTITLTIPSADEMARMGKEQLIPIAKQLGLETDGLKTKQELASAINALRAA